MKNTKLALSALILAGILFLASSCSDDNSVNSKNDGPTGEYAAIFVIQSTYYDYVAQNNNETNSRETTEECYVGASLTENGEFVAPEFAKCNGEDMVNDLIEGNSKGQYKYSTSYYEPEFNIVIGGYRYGTLSFNASINMIRFTNIAAGDTLGKNNLEISYTGVDPNMDLIVEINSPSFGYLIKHITAPEAAGTIKLTAEELSKIGGHTRINLLQNRDETFIYQYKPVLKHFVAISSVYCHVKD